MLNQQLWGELERQNVIWDSLSNYTWNDFKILSSTIEDTCETRIQGVLIENAKSTFEGISTIQTQGIKVEFSPCIIGNEVEMIVSVAVAKKDYKSAMLKSLPVYYYHSKVIEEILKTTSTEFKKVEFNSNDIEDNMFIDTTLSNIDRWERTLDINADKSKSYDFRREKIKSKLRAIGTTTKAMIKNVASAFSNGEVEVIEDNANYRFKVKFTGVKGIPENMEDLTEILEEIKPAHLDFDYNYTYNTWSFLSSKTWNDLSTQTWGDAQIFN